MSEFAPTFQLSYLAAAIAFFCITAYLPRARPRRIAGALASAAVFTALSAPIDTLAYRVGWWLYPTCAHPPLAIYVGQALIFVGGVALVGWRVQRRFGTRGVASFGAVVCGVGLVRDMTVAALFPRMIRLGAAPVAQLADVGAWAVVVIVALAVTRLVAGPARGDGPRP